MRFTVRRPPIGEVSPCSHRPSGGDVACSVHVGVAPRGSAGLALEDRLALAVPGCDVPARGASLRRVRSWDLFDPAQSLVLQTSGELAPPASSDRAVEPPFLGDSYAGVLDGASRGAGHRPHVKRLDPDHVEPPREVGGGFLDPVLTTVRLAGFQPGDRPFRLLAPVRAAVGSGEALLQHLQPLRLTPGQTGHVQRFAGRQRRRHDNTAVNANHTAIARAGDGIGDVRERDMPTTRPITSHPVGPDTCWQRPRQAKPHPPDLGHPHPTEAAIQPLDVMRFQTDLPKPFMHTSFTPPRAAMRTREETPHRLREISQRLLLHCLTPSTEPPIFRTSLRQLGRLLHVAGSLTAWLPVLLLLHRQVPHIPCVSAMPQQRLLLLRSRQQPEPRHVRTVTNGSDIHGRRKSTILRIRLHPRVQPGGSSRRELR